jgi:preprotein translocase subunit SecE
MARTSGAPGRVSVEGSRRAFSFRFVGDVVAELRRVTWPTRDETVRLTVMVIAVAAAVGLLLGLVDLAFARLFDVLLG